MISSRIPRSVCCGITTFLVAGADDPSKVSSSKPIVPDSANVAILHDPLFAKGGKGAEVRDEAPERGTIREENREVIETEESAPRNRPRGRELVQLHDLMLVVMRPERDGGAAPAKDAKPEYSLIENE